MKEIIIAVLAALPIHFFPNHDREYFLMAIVCLLTLVFFEVVDIRKNTTKGP